LILIFIILTFYFTSILGLSYGFTKIKNYEEIGLKPKTAFTIIVPFRDEANNLPILLESLTQLNYPANLFQVILVDDESKHKFEVPSFNFKVSVIDNYRVSNSPKKDAIVTAMQQVTTNWIITTDADCRVPKNWLLTLDNYIQTHDVEMIAGAVNYEGTDTFLHQFQQLDMASLQGATIGSFGIGKGFMCNGANLAYTKSLFESLNGFDGNNTTASGDDVFLLQKAIDTLPEEVHYLKSKYNIVSTQPVNSWSALFNQRVRWASKTSSYQSNFGKILALIVFAGNVAWLFAVGWSMYSFIMLQNLLFFIILKIVIDAVLILKANRFLSSKKTSYLIVSSLLYPIFSSSVALYSLFGKYEWKERRF